MKVLLKKPYGFCEGVHLSFKKIKEIREENLDKNIYVYGDLVHNKDALKELEEIKVKTIDRNEKSFLENISSLSKDDILVFSAHGHEEHLEEILKEKGIKFYDLTCPKVSKIHEIIKKETSLGREVIYLGKKNHIEAISSTSISNKVYLYDINEVFDFSKINKDNPIVINQTTLSPFELEKPIEEIKSRFKNVEIIDSICLSSKLRQESLLSLPKDLDLILVVGNKHSNNSMTLYRLACQSFPSASIYRIDNKDDLKDIELKKYRYAAIVSGASTPNRIVEEIETILKKI